jgi:hypothetical protein
MLVMKRISMDKTKWETLSRTTGGMCKIDGDFAFAREAVYTITHVFFFFNNNYTCQISVLFVPSKISIILHVSEVVSK